MPSLEGATRVASFSGDPGLVFEDPASGRINIAVVSTMLACVCKKKSSIRHPPFHVAQYQLEKNAYVVQETGKQREAICRMKDLQQRGSGKSGPE
jgi:hypothetical protein